jgi:multiple sugar transport system permease protein
MRSSAPPAEHTAQRPHVITHLLLVVLAVVMVVPFAWEVLTALKSLTEATRVPPTILPEHWEWSNFVTVFRELPMVDMFTNSVLLTLGRTAGQVLFCSAAAYAFARLEFPGRGLIFAVVLAMLMIPSQLFIIPQYQIMQHLGWLNTVQALFVPGMFSAFGTFLLRQFFLSLPREIEEAARLDGANPFQIYWRIALPLARPGLIALAVLTALWSWNDLLWPLVVNSSPTQQPLSAGLALLAGQEVTGLPVLMAGALLASLPMIALFILLQRHFIEGIAVGGSKG